METQAQADEAIAKLHGTTFNGNQIVVSVSIIMQ